MSLSLGTPQRFPSPYKGDPPGVTLLFLALRARRRTSIPRICRLVAAPGFRQCRHCGGGPDRAQCDTARYRMGTGGPAGLSDKAWRPNAVENEPVENEPVMNEPSSTKRP
jgi:hypothetical protein